jgi:hypothetical protein
VAVTVEVVPPETDAVYVPENVYPDTTNAIDDTVVDVGVNTTVIDVE